MGIYASHYAAPFRYGRGSDGRHMLLMPKTGDGIDATATLQGSAMSYPSKRELCEAIARSPWGRAGWPELDAQRVPPQLHKTLLWAVRVELRRLQRIERLAQRTRCPVAFRRPGLRDEVTRTVQAHRRLEAGLVKLLSHRPCPENIRPCEPPDSE